MDEGLLIRLHDEVLRQTGGASGIRDINLLRSASARPLNRYALGLFLDDNGLSLVAEQDDATRTMLALAAGELDIPALTEWLRTRVA